ncbi:MAG: hypothetical protein ACRCTJ_04385 [Brevinema sp.]
MGIIKRNKTYYLRMMINGVEYRKPLKTENKRVAQDIYNQWNYQYQVNKMNGMNGIPLIHISKNHKVEEVFTDDELERMWHYCIQNGKLDFMNYMITLFLTGARPNEILKMTKDDIDFENNTIVDNNCEIIILSCEIKRVNQGKTLIIGNQDTRQDDSMIKTLKLSWEWYEILLKDKIYANELSRQLGYKTPRYVENILRLRFLSPKIQKMVLTGQQKTNWTNKLLFSMKSHNWREQERGY